MFNEIQGQIIAFCAVTVVWLTLEQYDVYVCPVMYMMCAESQRTDMENTVCFKKSFTNLKEYINLCRGHTQRFELS
jgi:hypothetical protein